MKIALTFVLSTSIVGAACAQEPTTPAPSAPPAQTADVKPVAPADVEKAQKVLDEVSKAYKSAKAMTDTVKMEITTPMGTETQEVTIAIGSGHDAMFSVPGFSLIVVDGKVNFISDNVADKYFATPLEENLGKTVQNLFGDGFPLPPHFVLRTDAPTDQKLGALAMGFIGNAEITGYKQSEQDGAAMHEVDFASERGKGTAKIADASKLVRNVQFQFEPAPGMEIKAQIGMNPKVTDELAKPIAFVAGDRKAVDSMDQLQPTPINVGDEAPDFTLSTLDGETVSLSKLRGSVVVIDFWATWCGPCKRALPMLQEFATWAESSGQPVKVYGINSWEQSKSADERKKKVSEFWTKAEYKMATLMDNDDSVIGEYGFAGIPATVIVGPDGKVAAIHQGFSPDMVDVLKKDVADAQKTAG